MEKLNKENQFKVNKDNTPGGKLSLGNLGSSGNVVNILQKELNKPGNLTSRNNTTNFSKNTLNTGTK